MFGAVCSVLFSAVEAADDVVLLTAFFIGVTQLEAFSLSSVVVMVTLSGQNKEEVSISHRPIRPTIKSFIYHLPFCFIVTQLVQLLILWLFVIQNKTCSNEKRGKNKAENHTHGKCETLMRLIFKAFLSRRSFFAKEKLLN